MAAAEKAVSELGLAGVERLLSSIRWPSSDLLSPHMLLLRYLQVLILRNSLSTWSRLPRLILLRVLRQSLILLLRPILT